EGPVGWLRQFLAHQFEFAHDGLAPGRIPAIDGADKRLLGLIPRVAVESLCPSRSILLQRPAQDDQRRLVAIPRAVDRTPAVILAEGKGQAVLPAPPFSPPRPPYRDPSGICSPRSRSRAPCRLRFWE